MHQLFAPGDEADIYGTASKTHSGGRVSGKARREVGRTKENPEGAHGKWRTWGSRKPLPLPRSNDQSYFLSVILVSEKDSPQKKSN